MAAVLKNTKFGEFLTENVLLYLANRVLNKNIIIFMYEDRCVYSMLTFNYLLFIYVFLFFFTL